MLKIYLSVTLFSCQYVIFDLLTVHQTHCCVYELFYFLCCEQHLVFFLFYYFWWHVIVSVFGTVEAVNNDFGVAVQMIIWCGEVVKWIWFSFLITANYSASNYLQSGCINKSCFCPVEWNLVIPVHSWLSLLCEIAVAFWPRIVLSCLTSLLWFCWFSQWHHRRFFLGGRLTWINCRKVSWLNKNWKWLSQK